MGSLPWAEMPGKGFILFNIDTEKTTMDNKIVAAILMAANYKQSLSVTNLHITPASEYVSNRTNYEKRITLIPDKNKPKEMNYYLCS